MHNPPWYGYDFEETVKKAIDERNVNDVILGDAFTGNVMSLTAAVYINDRFDLFESLISAGATLTAEDLGWIIGYTPDSDANRIDSLLAGGVPCSADCLQTALRLGKWQIALTLLSYDVDTQTFMDEERKISLLHAVAWAGNAAVTERLLQKGAAVDSRDIDGMTPLMRICDGEYQYRTKTLRIIECLLMHGADPNAATPSSKTALLLCFGEPKKRKPNKKRKPDWFTQRADTVALLLRHGANPDVVSSVGTTPLMLAARDNDVALTRVLLQANANREMRTPDGKSAVDFAEKWESREVSALLRG